MLEVRFYQETLYEIIKLNDWHFLKSFWHAWYLWEIAADIFKNYSLDVHLHEYSHTHTYTCTHIHITHCKLQNSNGGLSPLYKVVWLWLCGDYQVIFFFQSFSVKILTKLKFDMNLQVSSIALVQREHDDKAILWLDVKKRKNKESSKFKSINELEVCIRSLWKVYEYNFCQVHPTWHQDHRVHLRVCTRQAMQMIGKIMWAVGLLCHVVVPSWHLKTLLASCLEEMEILPLSSPGISTEFCTTVASSISPKCRKVRSGSARAIKLSQHPYHQLMPPWSVLLSSFPTLCSALRRKFWHPSLRNSLMKTSVSSPLGISQAATKTYLAEGNRMAAQAAEARMSREATMDTWCKRKRTCSCKHDTHWMWNGALLWAILTAQAPILL